MKVSTVHIFGYDLLCFDDVPLADDTIRLYGIDNLFHFLLSYVSPSHIFHLLTSAEWEQESLAFAM